FVAPHRANHCNFVDHTSDMREPVGNRNARLTIPGEGPMTWDYRALHFGQIVSKANCIDHFPSPFVILGIKRVDVTDPAAHEQKNYGLCARRKMRHQFGVFDFALRSPERTHSCAEKSHACLEQKFSAGNSSAWINL